MPRITRRSQAVRDALQIWSYITDNISETSADATLRKIKQKIEVLAEHPTMGTLHSELMPRLHSFPVAGYLIFYIPLDNDDGIEIVRILHGRRDIEAIFLTGYDDLP
jgi:toxin ParE1/3/4